MVECSTGDRFGEPLGEWAGTLIGGAAVHRLAPELSSIDRGGHIKLVSVLPRPTRFIASGFLEAARFLLGEGEPCCSLFLTQLAHS